MEIEASNFAQVYPTHENFWRSIILFGRNVACYKFALAKSLLHFSKQDADFISLEELAKPFSKHIIEHLSHCPKQITNNSSKFLKSCEDYSKGELSNDEMISRTVNLGFQNVIDAFHNVNGQPTDVLFFHDERDGRKKGIRLTDDLLKLNENFQIINLPYEIEARWRLVETAWELNLPTRLVSVQYDATDEMLVIPNHAQRINVTPSRDALNGYQKGKCFYCFDDISIDSNSEKLCHVDHFFPHILQRKSILLNLDGIWNLVLACAKCNGGEGGKFHKVPERRFLERLHTRNEFLIKSHHPLRETLISQSGRTTVNRVSFLQQCYQEAKINLLHEWKPKFEFESVF